MRTLLAATAAVLLVAACGGGGGGGLAAPSTAVLSYTGNTNPATISATNAGALAAGVVGSGDAAAVVAGLAIEGGQAAPAGDRGAAAIGDRLARLLRSGVPPDWLAAAPTLAALQVDETEPCDGGVGSVRTVGTVGDNTFTGTLTLLFTGCLIDGDTLDGQATLRVDAFSIPFLLPTEATYTFALLSLRGPGVSADLSGTLRVQLEVGPNNRETVTSNLVVRDNLAGVTSKTEALVSTSFVVNSLLPEVWAQSIAGRVYHSQHGYVDVQTVVQLAYGALAQEFPGAGELLLRGGANASIRLRAVSESVLAVALDLDGNGIDEASATLAWTQLSAPAGANLADSDGDGMHDSWETANALDPASPADAALDQDGDGASNRDEYDMATDPGDAAATPPAVDAAIALTATPVAVAAGGQISYAIAVTRPSFADPIVYDVVVSADLPAGVTLVSATPERGSCSGTTSLVCRLGDLSSASVGLAVVVSPAVAGNLTTTFVLGARAFDPNPANDSAAATTTVGLALTGIQAQINTAAPGATILVPAGVYVGALDFGGKNVTLASASGPATTTLHGNGGTAVRIGPGGRLSGFTITGSATAVQAFGSGSSITGNVIAGNTGSAAGVFGNVASPTLERNVFRNNVCDTQFNSGVVVFANNSSPRIANNVFVDNPCRGVNLTLPSGPNPVVVNNTFVGNRTAIRVDRRVPQPTQTYRNNLIALNGTGLEVEFAVEPGDPVWTNNLVFGNTVDYVGIADQTGIAGSLSADPLLVDVAAGDYHLLAGSPAIDAGSASDAPTDDFDGNLRPQDGDGAGGAAVDIGAFEVSPPPL